MQSALQMVPTPAVQNQWFASTATHYRWLLLMMVAHVVSRTEQIVRAQDQGFDLIIVFTVIVVTRDPQHVRVTVDHVGSLVELVQFVHPGII